MKTCPTILLCFSVVTAAFSQTNDGSSWTAQAIAQKSLVAYAALASYSDTGKSVESEAGQTNITTFSIRMQRPKLFKIHWIQTGGNQTNEGTWWTDGHPLFSPEDTYLRTNTVGQPTNDRPKIISVPFAIDDVSKASGQATIVPEIFLKPEPDADNLLALVASGKSNFKSCKTELTEGKIGNVDCYVIAITWAAISRAEYHRGKALARLWIGKRDYLLHQIQSASETPDKAMTQIHENIRKNQSYPATDFQEPIPKNNSSITLHSSPPATFSDPRQK